MAAGTTIYTKTLDKVLVLAKAITAIGNSRAFQSYKRFAESSNFEKDVQALTAEVEAYFFCQLGDIELGGDGFSTPDFPILGELVVSTPKETSTDLNAAHDVAVSLADALRQSSNFIGADNTLALPKRVRFKRHLTEVTETGGITIFDFGYYGGGAIEFTDP